MWMSFEWSWSPLHQKSNLNNPFIKCLCSLTLEFVIIDLFQFHLNVAFDLIWSIIMMRFSIETNSLPNCYFWFFFHINCCSSSKFLLFKFGYCIYSVNYLMIKKKENKIIISTVRTKKVFIIIEEIETIDEYIQAIENNNLIKFTWIVWIFYRITFNQSYGSLSILDVLKIQESPQNKTVQRTHTKMANEVIFDRSATISTYYQYAQFHTQQIFIHELMFKPTK